MMYYIDLNLSLYIYIYMSYVSYVSLKLSREAIDNVGLYNDVVIRACNTDVLVIRG